MVSAATHRAYHDCWELAAPGSMGGMTGLRTSRWPYTLALVAIPKQDE